jgi:hypothetical protein
VLEPPGGARPGAEAMQLTLSMEHLHEDGPVDMQSSAPAVGGLVPGTEGDATVFVCPRCGTRVRFTARSNYVAMGRPDRRRSAA